MCVCEFTGLRLGGAAQFESVSHSEPSSGEPLVGHCPISHKLDNLPRHDVQRTAIAADEWPSGLRCFFVRSSRSCRKSSSESLSPTGAVLPRPIGKRSRSLHQEHRTLRQHRDLMAERSHRKLRCLWVVTV